MARAAVRYAKAILSLAQEQGITEVVHKDMQDIAQTIDKNKELQVFLESALIKATVKKAALEAVFVHTNALSKKLFDTLLQNKRIEVLSVVAKQYSVLFDALNNTQTATVTTAFPITEELTVAVLAKVKELTGNEATLKNIVDESIIGGFVLRVGDLQYNASIANKLTSLKRALRN